MTAPNIKILSSTSQLTPAGVLGYAKGIAVLIGGILAVLNEQIVDDDWEYKGYITAAIALCTLIATVAVPNAVKEAQVVDPPLPLPAPQPDSVIDDTPGQHAVDRDGLLGVVHPPVVNPDGPRAADH